MLMNKQCQIPLSLVAILIFLALYFSACTSTVPPSFWEPIVILAETEQSHAPALLVQNNIRVAAWIGADNAGIHQDARLLINNSLGEAVTLPLPPAQPYSQQLLPGVNEQYHLLWLDQDTSNELRLHSALLNPDLSIARGPVIVSDRRTGRFIAMSLGDGKVLVLWSGGPLAEPTIFTQVVSARGIPEAPQPLITNAEWPAMIQANDGTRHLTWLESSTRQLHYGQLNNGQLIGNDTITNTLNLSDGDRLHGFQLGLDFTHVYLFWNITPHAGTDEAWYSARALGGGAWSTPQQLGIGESLATTIETGLNTGIVQATTEGNTWLKWASPLAGQFDVLPVAVSQGNELGIVYLQSGDQIGYQPVKPLRGPLIGLPTLLTDRKSLSLSGMGRAYQRGQGAAKIGGHSPLTGGQEYRSIRDKRFLASIRPTTSRNKLVT